MAKILPNSPDHFRGTRQGRHPWSEYFDGQTRLLEAGTDFPASPLSMRASAKLAAKKLNVVIRTKVTPEGNLILQALRTPDETPAE